MPDDERYIKRVVAIGHPHSRVVKVELGGPVIGDSRITVATATDFDTLDFRPEVELTWSGTANRDLGYAVEFHAALSQAILVAGWMNRLLAHPEWMGRDRDDIVPKVDLGRLPDYALALYVIWKDTGDFTYVRDRVLEPGMSKACIDREGMLARALATLNEED